MGSRTKGFCHANPTYIKLKILYKNNAGSQKESASPIMSRKIADKCTYCRFCTRHAWRANNTPNELQLAQIGLEFMDVSKKFIEYVSILALSVFRQTYLQVVSAYRGAPNA